MHDDGCECGDCGFDGWLDVPALTGSWETVDELAAGVDDLSWDSEA